MTQEEFKALWLREASEQYGMILDVVSLEHSVLYAQQENSTAQK